MPALTRDQGAAASPVAAEAGAPSAEPTWPCPACGNRNPMALDACEVCGTSFAALMRRSEEPVHIPPLVA